ncbi:MAG: sialidase family protein, partial [Opitutaceae bacterium]
SPMLKIFSFRPGRSTRRSWCVLALAALFLATPPVFSAEILSVQKIWDRGAHNAFTDLIRWHNRWWCTFREADAHVGGDGLIRILTSTDGRTWESAAGVTEPGIDLRDPKFSVMPDGRLMLNCGGSVYEGKTLKGKRSRVSFSKDGRQWTTPVPILPDGEWCWRVTWYDGVAYAAAYNSKGPSGQPGKAWTMTVYRSTDGLAWSLVKVLDVPDQPNETTLRFAPDGTMIALVRREAGDKLGWVGHAPPPYTQWTWQTSNHRFGGQNLLLLPDGRWIVGTRDYTGIKAGAKSGAHTIVAELERDGRLTPLVTLPSGGDTSYPGLVWYDGKLAVSYYSSHEGKTSIYFAEVKL